MAITIEEQPDSPIFNFSRDGFKYTRNLNIHGTLEPIDALPFLPNIGDQLVVKSVLQNAFVTTLDIVQSDEAIVTGKELLRATLVYISPEQEEPEPPQRPQPNIATWRVSGAAQTVHVETILPESEPKFIPDDAEYQGRAIRVTDDGVQGVDIIAPAATLIIEHWLPTATADANFVDSILSIAASTNEAPFNGPWGNWKPFEALYVGPEISFVTPELVSIVHTFQLAKNELIKVNLDCPSALEAIQKLAHDFFWTITKPACDPSDPKKIIQAAVISAHVSKVFPNKDFSVLNLPAEFVGGSS